MNRAAVFLILTSAFMHVGWNLFIRRTKDEFQVLKELLAGILVLGAIPFLYLQLGVPLFPGKVWICLVCSGFFCGLYLNSLARAYRRDEFVVVYPMIRALPVLLVCLGDVIRGRDPSVPGFLGMLLVVAGCLVIPYHSFRKIEFRKYFHRVSLWIFTGALGITGYSLSDKIASELVVRGPVTAFRYGYVFFVSTTFFFLCFGALTRRVIRISFRELGVAWKRLTVGAALMFGSYWFILWAYQLTWRAAYVVALRQFSIILGVVCGLLFFHEKGIVVRIVAAFFICAGIIIISLYG